MARPVRTAVRQQVLDAVAAGASSREAAAIAGIGHTTASVIARESRAAVDVGELRITVGANVAAFVQELSAGLEAQARRLSDPAWGNAHAAELFDAAQALRLSTDVLIRVLQTWGLGDGGRDREP